jgi:transposase
MDERMQFVARRLAGEPMAELCREFGISRKTGYKIVDRYQECGIEGLTDRSRRPYRYAQQLPFQVENFILNVKREHASWGARKIRERLIRRFSGVKIPAKSTIHAVLDRHGLVERRGRVRHRAQGTPLSLGQRPNELWCTDYKGEFLLGNHKYCYPLTVTDHASDLEDPKVFLFELTPFQKTATIVRLNVSRLSAKLTPIFPLPRCDARCVMPQLGLKRKPYKATQLADFLAP